jgi:hypothetical protein
MPVERCSMCYKLMGYATRLLAIYAGMMHLSFVAAL